MPRNELTMLLEETLRAYAGRDDGLSGKYPKSSLEFRLLFNVDFSLPFKEARKKFIRAYFSSMLVKSFGNISRAAELTGVNRRHIHRIISELSIDAAHYRRELVRPYDYMKENVQQVMEAAIEESQFPEGGRQAQDIYSKIDDISSLVAGSVEASLSFDDALGMFEREYIERKLRETGNDLDRTAAEMSMSSRTLYRKLKRLSIRY